MNLNSFMLSSLLGLLLHISLNARELSKLPTRSIYAQAQHTIKVFRRTNRFAPQKEEIETGKWNSVLHLDKGLILDTSKLKINSSLKTFNQTEFPLFNWRYFVKDPHQYQTVKNKYKDNPHKKFYKGGPNNRYSYVTVDNQKQAAFYRLNPTTYIKETYTNDQHDRLQPYEQTIYREFKNDHQTYNLVWKVKFKDFSKRPPQEENLGSIYPSSNKFRQWENRLMIHKGVTP